MNKKDFDNSLLRQAKIAEDMILHVHGKVMEQLSEALPMKEIFDAQKIFITGCGDSWLAGIAAKPAFECLTKVETNVMRAVEFSRILSSKNLGYSPNTPMVIVISYSGEATRAVECAQRAAATGANTIAVTSNPESRLAKACRHTINVSLPEGGEYFPGGTTYNASLVALMLIAQRIGRAKNTISHGVHGDITKELLSFVHECQLKLDEYDDQAFELAKCWTDLRCIDFIGDYADFATAYFGSAKVIETYGGYTTYDDSEDWCHINYFLAQPETIGRVVITNKSTPSFGRMSETLAAVKSLGSPCMVVSDGVKDDFPDGFEVFTTPTPKYFWMNPLVQHIPFDLVSGYIAAFKGETAFRAGVAEFADEFLTARLKGGTKIDIV